MKKYRFRILVVFESSLLDFFEIFNGFCSFAYNNVATTFPYMFAMFVHFSIAIRMQYIVVPCAPFEKYVLEMTILPYIFFSFSLVLFLIFDIS